MSSVRGVESWQDAYIFCLQPNFQDDLWLFMIFAAIQVSLAGLKLTSFFINRWARGSKVGSGDDDEDNVGDDGASGGISIMGVLTLIAGALILAAYCDNEPDEKTFNIFKAGVYLNTFLFAVALIFICGLVVAFVVDILTRRRGRSITFRMFLGGTIVLSIAASFFGATGIMGLKYIQSECYDEVNLYHQDQDNYLKTQKDFAREIIDGSFTEPTKELLFGKYPDEIIGEPVIFSQKVTEDEVYYVYSVIVKETSWKRQAILDQKIYTAEYTYDTDENISGLKFGPTAARCFETAEGFNEINGLMKCPVNFLMPEQKYGRYEEATKQIVDRNDCAHKENDMVCNVNSLSYPLCCKQFSNDYTKNEDCHCINNHNDASCSFVKTKDCDYVLDTLNLADADERAYYCSKNPTMANDFCSKTGDKYDWDEQCATGTSDQKYECCRNLYVEHAWKKWGNDVKLDMTPKSCKDFEKCHLGDQFFNDECCGDNPDCAYCEDTTEATAAESDHANTCGYSHCLSMGIQEKKECCKLVETKFDFKFETDHSCEKAINYDPCTDNTNSLGCKAVRDACPETKDCFPSCCDGLKFDFATPDTIKDSVNSACFQQASELIISAHDNNNLLGHYIYHKTGKDESKRHSCKKVQGIIDPKCCNGKVAGLYNIDDPCHCHGKSPDGNRCKKVHHKECLPSAYKNGNGNLQLSGAFPQCCYDIGDVFGSDHFCSCRFEENLTGENSVCNNAEISTSVLDFIDVCPNPCKKDESDPTKTIKALISGETLICEIPVFDL